MPAEQETAAGEDSDHSDNLADKLQKEAMELDKLQKEAMEQHEEQSYSATSRARFRVEWAKDVQKQLNDTAAAAATGDELESSLQRILPEKSKWYCDDPTTCCDTEICQAVRELRDSLRELSDSLEELATAKAELITATTNVNHDNSNNASIARLLKELFDAKKATVGDKKATVGDKATLLVKASTSLQDKNVITKDSLCQMAQAGNRTQHVTGGTQESEHKKTAAQGGLDESRMGKPQPASPGTMQLILGNAFPDLLASDLEGYDDIVEAGDKLTPFWTFLQELLGACQECNEEYASKDYMKKIGKTVQVILNWKPNYSHSEGTFYRPSGQSEETRGAHPILFAIMEKIVTLLDEKTQVTHEQFIPETHFRSRRFIDGVGDNVMELLRATTAAYLGAAIEIKPVSRANAILQPCFDVAGALQPCARHVFSADATLKPCFDIAGAFKPCAQPPSNDESSRATTFLHEYVCICMHACS